MPTPWQRRHPSPDDNPGSTLETPMSEDRFYIEGTEALKPDAALAI